MSSTMYRRSFLKSIGLAAAATTSVAAIPIGTTQTALAKEHAVAGSNKGVIYKSVKFGMVKTGGSIEDRFKALQDLGYDGVELNSPGGADKKEARRASEKTGLPIHGVVDSIHWGTRLSDPNPGTRQKGLDGLLTAIKDSHLVGGSSVLLVPGHGKDGTQDQVAKRSIEQIHKALPLASKLGIHILIENVWNAFLYKHDGPDDQTADALAKYIDDIDSPWVGVYFDIGNHHKYGQPQQWIRTLGKRIVKLDVKGYSRSKPGWTGIGEGTINWKDIQKALKEIGFSGWATAEVGGGDKNRLKQVAERMDKVLGL